MLFTTSAAIRGMEQPQEAKNTPYTNKEVTALKAYAKIFKGHNPPTIMDTGHLLALLEIFSLHHHLPADLAQLIIESHYTIYGKTVNHKLLCARLQQVGFTSKEILPKYMYSYPYKAQIFKDSIIFSENKTTHMIFKPNSLAESQETRRIGGYNPVFVSDNDGVLVQYGHQYKYIHGTQELNFNAALATTFFFDNGVTYTPLVISKDLFLSFVDYKIITKKKLSIAAIKRHLLSTDLILPDCQITIDLENDRCILSESKYYTNKVKTHIGYLDMPTINSSDEIMVVTTYSREIPVTVPTIDIWTIERDGTTTHTNTFTLPSLNFNFFNQPIVSVFGKLYVEQQCSNSRNNDQQEIKFFDCTNGKHICSLLCSLQEHGRELMTFAHDKMVMMNNKGKVEVWNLGKLADSEQLALQHYKADEPTIFTFTQTDLLHG
jgi:hypothetical protein